VARSEHQEPRAPTVNQVLQAYRGRPVPRVSRDKTEVLVSKDSRADKEREDSQDLLERQGPQDR
jgi:hypothetical protein